MYWRITSTLRLANVSPLYTHKSFYIRQRIPVRNRNVSGTSLTYLNNLQRKVITCIQKCNYYTSCKESRFNCKKGADNENFNTRMSFKFHEELEQSINEQINAEFKAYYHYLSMAAYFGRVDVALPGCESFFTQMYHEEHEHALRFLNYINMRGGRVRLCPVIPPNDQEWKCPLTAFQTALQLELNVTEKLTATNKVAEKHNDLNAADFIVTGFMDDQMKSVNEIAKLITVLSGVGDRDLARFLFDKDLLDNYVMPEFNVLKGKKRK